jgi:hypothetical protein
MAKPPETEIEIDPRRGDAILKRMLQTKPKTHDEMVKERRQPKSGKKPK